MEIREQFVLDLNDEPTLVSGEAGLGDRLLAVSAQEMEIDGAQDGCMRELYPYQGWPPCT